MIKRDFLILFTLSMGILAGVHYYINSMPVITHMPHELTDGSGEPVIIPVRLDEFGIPVDSFRVVEGRVRRNQTLSTIMSEYNISPPLINLIAGSPRGLFDARRIRAGSRYRVFFTNDSINLPRYFIYEPDPVEYVKIHLHDTVIIERGSRQVKKVVKSAAGHINSSLWDAMMDNDLPPVLAIELSEIYAWSIDFFGLKHGDQFGFIYTEDYIDSLSVGIDKIIAAYFNHMGREFYAIPFEQDSIISFFDQEGNSLRRTFLKAPLRYSRISSGFSHSRMHPIYRVRRPHHGVDYAAPVGTPVLAIGDGRVIETSYSAGAGRMIRIRHNSVYTSAYLHLRNYASGIRQNVWVKQGDVIGYVGSTGASTGPHLDFRIWRNGQPVNPLSIEAPPVEPVAEENMEAFDRAKEIWTERLDQLIIGDK
ncbi:MAG: peptidoglycan DD-metalloendopeptidase family protein [Bacteroidales bacterium]